MKDLECHPALEGEVLGQIDRRHAAMAELALDRVAAR
jgi:hypothetical protein